MARTLSKSKGRRATVPFVAVPIALLGSPKYATLSPRAVKALMDLYGQYRGANNGDLTAAWSVMQAKGWRSKDSLYRALTELLEAGFVQRTRQGGRHACSLYAVTWKAIDSCGGKLDVSPTRVPAGTWKGAPNTDHSTPPAGQISGKRR